VFLLRAHNPTADRPTDRQPTDRQTDSAQHDNRQTDGLGLGGAALRCVCSVYHPLSIFLLPQDLSYFSNTVTVGPYEVVTKAQLRALQVDGALRLVLFSSRHPVSGLLICPIAHVK
jgi:hypothetical protein